MPLVFAPEGAVAIRMAELFVMRLPSVAAILWIALSSNGPAPTDQPVDSHSRAKLTINPRFHSAGYFPFTGALLNHNPVLDVNVFYENEAFGFFLFQSLDLADRHSYANYFQPGVFASFRVQPSLSIRAIFGYLFSQTQGFRDSDSDYYALAMANWGISKHLRLENTLQLYDYSHNKKLAYRLVLERSSRKFRASLFLWQRVVLGENFSSTSAALSFTFPILPLGEKGSLELTSSYMGYLSAVKPDFALANGFLFTLSVPITVK